MGFMLFQLKKLIFLYIKTRINFLQTHMFCSLDSTIFIINVKIYILLEFRKNVKKFKGN